MFKTQGYDDPLTSKGDLMDLTVLWLTHNDLHVNRGPLRKKRGAAVF